MIGRASLNVAAWFLAVSASAFAAEAQTMRMDNADGKRPEFALPFEWDYYDQTG